MKSKIKTILSVLAAILLISSCSKYEEGPAISFRTKKARVSNEWIIEKAVDITENVDITDDYKGEIWDFRSDGTFIKNGEIKGTWDFYNDKEAIIITKTGGDSDIFNILKLKEKEMHLEILGEEELFFIPL